MPATRRAWLATAVMATFVVAGCGAAGPLPSAGDDSSASASPSPDASQLVAGACPNFVEVVETGPMPGDDGTEDGPVARAQQRISGDVDAAAAYGAAHPDEFASVRYENGPRVRLVIGFTAHIEEHCAALRAILEYPDEFEIIRQPATEARLMEIQQEIVNWAPGKVLAVGIGAGTIDVTLRADAESVADEISAKFGDLLTIYVGMLAYPDPFAGSPNCAGLIGPIVTDTPFAVTVQLESDTVRSGADFKATAVVTNTSSESAILDTGQPMTAVIFRRGSDRAIGGFTGGIGGTGFGGNIEPGGHLDIPVLGGTASCDPALGYALPPGGYDVRVPVDQYTMHENAPTDIAYLLSEPAPLTIIP